jgi:hypothetical protein
MLLGYIVVVFTEAIVADLDKVCKGISKCLLYKGLQRSRRGPRPNPLCYKDLQRKSSKGQLLYTIFLTPYEIMI